MTNVVPFRRRHPKTEPIPKGWQKVEGTGLHPETKNILIERVPDGDKRNAP